MGMRRTPYVRPRTLRYARPVATWRSALDSPATSTKQKPASAVTHGYLCIEFSSLLDRSGHSLHQSVFGIGVRFLILPATLRQASIKSETSLSSTSRTPSYSVRFRMSWHFDRTRQTWARAKSVRQHLKNDVPLRWPEPVVPERRQTECVSGAVGKIEPAVQGVLIVLRVLQPSQARADETCELLRIGRFLRENVSRTREAIKRRWGGHVPIQSPRVSAAQAPASRTRFPTGRAWKTRRPCTP